MKTGEIIGIAGGATVVGAIVWFIYGKTKTSDRLSFDPDNKSEVERIRDAAVGIRGGARVRSTKKTYNNNTKNTKNNSRKKRC